MIAELGHYALVLALILACAQASLPMLGANLGHRPWMKLGQAAALGQAGFLGFAFLALILVFLRSDFSVALVYRHSHSAMPAIYKIAAAWGQHEGSLLLWVLILALFGGGLAAFGQGLPQRLKARILAVQGAIGAVFLLFMLTTSNPFLRLDPAPFEGVELNPLLQDPGLAFHPPLLYLGYVGFSLAFSFAIAALIEGRIDAAWARWAKPWVLLSWLALTAGITLGSRWAYYELGWGGWWFWDPVENASLMPWLMGTALLHSIIVVEKRDALKAWSVLLAILAFGFSLLGTFLVRSGIVTSVHAFAQDPARGLFVLGILALAIGGGLIVFAWRAPQLRPGGLFAPISREAALLVNNMLLAVAAGTVLLGTLYPVLLDFLGGGAVSVGPPYYLATFAPIALPLVLLMGLGPHLGWKRGDLKGAAERLIAAAIIALIVFGTTLWIRFGEDIAAALGVAAGAFVIAASLTEWAERVALFRRDARASFARARHLPLSFYGMSLAHIGLGIAAIGMVASSAWKTEMTSAIGIGEALALDGRSYRLAAIDRLQGENYASLRARIVVSENGRAIAELYPERRIYRVQSQPTTEAAISSGFTGDLYVALGEAAKNADGNPRWTLRIYHEPLVPWIWAGGALMTLGGLVSLADRRYRIGAPHRASPRATPALDSARPAP